MSEKRADIWIGILSGLLSCGIISCTPKLVIDTQSTALPTQSFEESGLDSSFWRAATNMATTLPVDAMVVLAKGAVVAEYYNGSHTRRTLHDMRSTTKSITSMLVGAALLHGVIDTLDIPVSPVLGRSNSSFSAHASWSDYSALTLEDLLRMQSGLDCDDWTQRSPGHEERMYRTRDWLKFFGAIPARSAPGESFSYCTAGVVAIGAVLSELAGEPLDVLAQRWLFEPLGIHAARWNPAGRTAAIDAGGHLEISAESLLKIGQLLLQRGHHEGQVLMDENYLQSMVIPHVSLRPDGIGPHYGYLWWLEPVEKGVARSYQTRGNGGQFAMVFPEFDAVIVFTGHAYNRSDISMEFFQIASQYLIPMIENGTL